jgi:DNA mismatch repair protein MutS
VSTGKPIEGSSAETPMMRQYLGVKAEHPGAIVLFRMGDFFETFYDDARTCSELLDLTLTARSKEKDPVPMAGVPHHAVESYVARLVDFGKTVVLVDQVEDPKKAKGLVKREVTRVLTPGTFIDPSASPRSLSYLAAIVIEGGKTWGLAALDLSTGELRATRGEGADLLVDELGRLEAKELLLSEVDRDHEIVARARADVRRLTFTEIADDRSAIDALVKQIGGDEVDAVEKILGRSPLVAASRTIAYAERTQLLQASFERQAGGSLGHVLGLTPYLPGDALILDQEARAHLELFRSSGEGGRKGSLLGAIDEAVTAMGGRLLQRWLARPLSDPKKVRARQDAVEALISAPSALDLLRSALKEVHDLERLLGRVVMGRSSPRDLGALRTSLEKVPAVLAAGGEAHRAWRSAPQVSLQMYGALGADEELLGSAADRDACLDVQELIARTLVDSPPTELGEARVFREGIDAELDRLMGLSKSAKDVLAEIERRERERTGIGSLKVRYNRVFGYFIEITKANLKAVPKDYVRKQTTAGGERFYTEELKSYEEQILHADEHRLARETELFRQLVSNVAKEAKRLAVLCETIAELDVLAAFAHLAERRGYRRPLVDLEDRIEIIDGKHPVLESLSLGEPFVPNDLFIDRDKRLFIITGPNMAGKSTIMRQTALIVILAQMGSFVPAKEAKIGIVDRIFTRVGASDDLSRGRSTFMVEMAETSRILRSATKRSLILLDEIGRGTSTFDGLSIAWAVAEHLHDAIGAKTLFATHYHELTEITREKPSAVNFHVAVKEWGDKIIFLRKLLPGPTNRSYGVQVARLAGLPKPVVDRARAVLDALEAQELRAGGGPAERAQKKRAQLSLFTEKSAPSSSPEEAEVLAGIRETSVDDLTPREALAKIADWQQKLR